MSFHVQSQMIRSSKTSLAHLKSSIDLINKSSARLSTKSAYLALEGLRSCVLSIMSSELIGSGETPLTIRPLALIGFFSYNNKSRNETDFRENFVNPKCGWVTNFYSSLWLIPLGLNPQILIWVWGRKCVTECVFHSLTVVIQFEWPIDKVTDCQWENRLDSLTSNRSRLSNGFGLFCPFCWSHQLLILNKLNCSQFVSG